MEQVLRNWYGNVRLKITRRLTGSIDGLQLSHFQVGDVYDVGTALGSYLLALGAAEPVLAEPPAKIVPIGPETDQERRARTSSEPLFEAADSQPRKR